MALTTTEFAKRVRAKYPGEYDSIDDDELTRRVVKKYPEYESQVEFRTADTKAAPAPSGRTPTPLLDRTGQTGAEVKRAAATPETLLGRTAKVQREVFERAKSGVASAAAGAVDATLGLAGLAVDAASYTAQGGVIGRKLSGKSVIPDLPATAAATRVADRVREKGREILDVDPNLDTEVLDATVRLGTDVAIPLPLGKIGKAARNIGPKRVAGAVDDAAKWTEAGNPLTSFTKPDAEEAAFLRMNERASEGMDSGEAIGRYQAEANRAFEDAQSPIPDGGKVADRLEKRLGISREEANYLAENGVLPENSASVARLRSEGYLDDFQQPTEKLEAEVRRTAITEAPTPRSANDVAIAQPRRTTANRERMKALVGKDLDNFEDVNFERFTSDKSGLPNERAFTRDRAAAEASGRDFGAADMTNFKLYNQYGRAGGDTAIAQVADAWDVATSGTGVKVYHLKGDEFAFIDEVGDELDTVYDRFDDVMDGATIKVTKPDGAVVELQFLGSQKGKGKTYELAEQGQNADAARKLASGDRRSRDEVDRIVESAEGSAGRGGDSAGLEARTGNPAAQEAGVGGGAPPKPPSATPPPGGPSTPGDPVKKVVDALKRAKPLRAEQEQIYTKARRAQIEGSIAAREGTSGEAGFYSELGAMKGELPKVEFESLRSQIGQSDIDALFDTVRDFDGISDFQKLSARKGLAKLFGEYGGQVPTNSEIALLKKVFGPEFTETAMSKRGMMAKLRELGLDVANVPRSLMASFDLSAPFRQGVFFIGRPRQFFPAFREMFHSFGSERAYHAINDAIRARPTYDLMDESGLALSELGDIAGREEKFASNLAEKIPGVGRVVRASGRAYTAYLNKLRADVFDDLVTKATAQGLDPESNISLVRSIAQFVNAGTGRGSLSQALQGASNVLNAFFFSPKLMSSRLTLLNPMYYVRQPAFVRKEAIKSALSFAGVGASVASLAGMAGAQVETDPRSSDFGKIKIRNTRIDPWGGFQQYVRMAAQLATGEYISATTGMKKNLGEGYTTPSRYDILLRQVESKEAPMFSLATSILRQRDYRGEPVSIPKEVGEMFVPMVVQDMTELAKSDPDLMPLGALAVLGFGVQTFEPMDEKKRRRVEAEKRRQAAKERREKVKQQRLAERE